MSNFFGIDHVQLAAPNGSEEKARLFFGEILGMKEIPKPSNLAKRGGISGSNAVIISFTLAFRNIFKLQRRLTQLFL